ncbi:hypothetical protein [Accumulibacter sp.]|uniref:hypothetical protein n=1 Tax=Accumulibacter sp. TaxID=2053492 RepID=UPI001A4B4A0D|nr:hypothetical protein [Accumulibacter sp.]MBL8401644.1 hypothetical protein [Accumulibacter sp.]
MIHWSLNPEYAASAVATVFGNIDRVFALEGDLIAHDSLSRVLSVSAGGRRYYVKGYSGADRALYCRSREGGPALTTLPMTPGLCERRWPWTH